MPRRLCISFVAVLLFLFVFRLEAMGAWPDCAPEIPKHCAAAVDDYELFQCLHRKSDHLTPACREFVRSEFARVRSRARASCKADYARFCWHVLPGNGRIFRCLQRRLPELSPACRAQFESLPRV